MPLPSRYRLVIPEFEPKTPAENFDNMRALDRWANGILPGGYDYISRTQLYAPQASPWTVLSPIPQQYASLHCIVMGRTDAAGVNDIAVYLQANGDTNVNNYEFELLQGLGGAIQGINGATAPGMLLGSLPGVTATANRAGIIDALFVEYAGATFTKLCVSKYSSQDGVQSRAGTWSGLWKNTSPIKTSLVLTTNSAANFLAGTTISFYGMTY